MMTELSVLLMQSKKKNDESIQIIMELLKIRSDQDFKLKGSCFKNSTGTIC